MKKTLKKTLYISLAAVGCFMIAYGMAAFATLEIDLREWDMIARWGVIWSGFIATLLCAMVITK